MLMKEIETGSSGNSCYLIPHKNQVILIDIGISISNIRNHILENENLDIYDEIVDVLLLITHTHSDHLKRATLSMLEKKKKPQNRLKVVLPQTNEGVINWNKHEIHYKQFRHGDIFTTCYVIDNKYAYLTDVSPIEIYNILATDMLYNLDEFFIEGNYDEEYIKFSAQLNTSLSYDVSLGFSRHLSKQQAYSIINVLEPKKFHLIHRSHRYYDISNSLIDSIKDLNRRVFIFMGKLDSLNKLIGSSNHNRYVGGAIKKRNTQLIATQIDKNETLLKDNGNYTFKWHRSNKREDPDNIASAVKFILDGLQQAGILKNDNWTAIKTIKHEFYADTLEGHEYVEVVVEYEL